jgi:adenylate cyclase
VTDEPTRAAELEQLLLGGVRRYTRDQASEFSGVPAQQARRLWRALGFPNVEDGAEAFTDADLDALRRITGLIEDGIIDDAAAVQVTRAMGQALARLAEGQVETLMAASSQPEADANEVARRLLPELELLLVYAWRRQLAAAAGRVLEAEAGETTSGQLAVGFADLVGFTRLSQRLEDAELAELMEAFESRAADVVASLGGRVVKTLGDEVLFVAGTTDAGAEIALQMIESMAEHERVPRLRVGAAFGNVLSRMGDVFGTTVNLASRLTALAPPDGVVVDREMARLLATRPEYQVRAMWRRRVRGFGTVEPWLLTRSATIVAPADRPEPADPASG